MLIPSRVLVQNLTFNEVALFMHLIEILMFFVRQHLFRSRFMLLSEGLVARIAQLLSAPQKHLKLSKYTQVANRQSADRILAALKFFRICIGLNDAWYNEQLIKYRCFSPILDMVFETMPRDNLVNSACLEFFEFIKRENIKPLIRHIAETYREKLQDITYVDLFQELVLRYDQMQDYNPEMEHSLFPQEDDSTPSRVKMNGSQRWQGVKEMDAAEEEYFNTSDDEDELAAKPKVLSPATNGVSPLSKPLVDYPLDEDDDESTEIKFRDIGSATSPSAADADTSSTLPADISSPRTTTPIPQTPPERLSEKRRREDDEEDELGKLSLIKRRSSSISSVGSKNNNAPNFLRRKKSFITNKDSPAGKKIAISLSVKPIEMEPARDEGG